MTLSDLVGEEERGRGREELEEVGADMKV